MTIKKNPPATRWKPGESGNPAGKRPGTIGIASKLRQSIDAKAIIAKLQEAALAGDVQAARTLLERALPVYRVAAEPVNVPGMHATALSDKATAVLSAVAQGVLPPDIGAQLVTAIGAVARVIEMDELERRLTALEAQREARN